MLAAGREVTQQAGVAMERLIIPNDTLLDAADDFGIVALVHDDRFTVRELIAGTRDEASLTWKTAQKLGAPLDEAKRLDDRWINYTGPHDTIPSVSAKNVLDGVDTAFFPWEDRRHRWEAGHRESQAGRGFVQHAVSSPRSSWQRAADERRGGAGKHARESPAWKLAHSQW
jgi:hypothetical protein